MEISKQKLKEMYGNERVMVVPYQVLSSIEDKFSLPGQQPAWLYKKIMDNYRFIFRYDAEYDSAFQQIIPCALMANHDETQYYVAHRIHADDRFFDTYMITFGGHVSPVDNRVAMPIFSGLMRELREELNYTQLKGTRECLLGTVRDIASDHFGLVYKFQIQKKVSINEKDKLRGQWMSMDDLYKNYHKFESWSRYIIDHLYFNSKRRAS